MSRPTPKAGPLLCTLASAGLVIFCPAVAFAHTGNMVGGGLLAGFEHPIRGVDHMLAMVAVGLWGAILGRPLIFLLPLIFPTVMSIGGVFGMLHVGFPAIETGIAISVLSLGAAIATAYAAPVWLACIVIGVFALFHGYAHGAELPSAADPIGYSVGFVTATGLLHLAGIGVGFTYNTAIGARVVRIVGIAISAAGAYFLWSALQ